MSTPFQGEPFAITYERSGVQHTTIEFYTTYEEAEEEAMATVETYGEVSACIWALKATVIPSRATVIPSKKD